MISRREFLVSASGLGVMTPRAAAPVTGAAPSRLDEIIKSAPRARYWVSSTSGPVACAACHEVGTARKPSPHDARRPVIKCQLCAQQCVLHPTERGRCRARMNVGGEMRSLVYGRPIAVHVDPIEKKPFYHFLPGASAFSLATSGCPLRCKFCQNWQISQSSPEDHEGMSVSPATIVEAATSRQAPVVAFTYNEPTVFTEYMADIAKAGRAQKLRSVMISCGMANPEPLAELCSLLDAIKIDLKGFNEDFYRNVCGGELKPVLRSIKQIAASGRVHLEIVNLVVPTLNDSEKMLRELAEWIAGETGPDVPLHFTRFHPDYQLLNLPPTPVSTLERAREIAMAKGIHYAFVGNVPDHPGNHTYCPGCGKVVVRRNGFFVTETNLKGGHCKFCSRKITGVWS